MEFLSQLDIIQWVFLIIGLVLAGPVVLDYGKNLLDKVPKKDKDNKPKPTPHTDDHDLTDLVCKWECLADAVHEAELHDACKKLEEVFPLLIKVRKIEGE